MNQVSQNASETAGLSEYSSNPSAKGMAIEHNASAEMKRISASLTQSAQVVHALGERSKEISGIVQTIRGIADQTNLLELNYRNLKLGFVRMIPRLVLGLLVLIAADLVLDSARENEAPLILRLPGPAAEGSPESRPFARSKANKLALRNTALTPRYGWSAGPVAKVAVLGQRD